MSLVTVLFYTRPIFTLFKASFQLGEKISIYDIITTLFSFIGIVCVIQPEFLFGGSSHSFYYTVAVVFSILIALANSETTVMYRKIRAKINYHILQYYGSITYTIAGSILLFTQ